MEIPEPAELIEQIQALAPGQLLLERLSGQPGVYLVGGAVRDLLLGGRPNELDLVIEGDPAAVASALGGSRVVHDRFGTSTVRTDGFSYDIARSRRETYAHPGALPDVSPAPLAEDLRRRDFTVNAMAVALDGERPGEISAAAHGLEDLAAAQLRVLHAGSFRDDPTRLLRLARYAARLGFSVEAETMRRLEEALAAGALGTVSGPRVGHELRLILSEPDPVAALLALRDLGLDAAIHPRFGLRDPERVRRALALLPRDGRADRLLLASACLELADPSGLLDALAFEAGDRDAVAVTASRLEQLTQALSTARRPSELARALSAAPPEAVALAGAGGPEQPARRWLEDLRHVRLEIDGRDLLAAGVEEGPSIGRALRAALDAKLDGHAGGRDEQLAVALEAAGHSG